MKRLLRFYFTGLLSAVILAGCGSGGSNDTVALSSGKAITAYSLDGVTGTIDETAKTIAVTLPYGTNVTALVATFTTTGAGVKVGSTVQTSGTTANDFTSPVIYTVTAADGTTATYTVTVTVALSSDKAITAYSLDGVTGTIDETAKTISVVMPYGTSNVTALVATFTTTGTGVKVGAVAQTSGTTANDFTSPVVYTVTAADGTTAAYTVTVTVGAGVINLPKTGQTTSYATGDDGDLEKGVAQSPRFSAGTGAEADCVTDNLTGLMWVKSPDSTSRAWTDALTYANDLDLCGHTDWRLPNVNELESLVDVSKANIAASLNDGSFSTVQSSPYWSSTTQAGNTLNAFYVNMGSGVVNYIGGKDSAQYVWPVRSVQ